MEAIDIFSRVYTFEDRVLVHVLRQWQLNQNAVNSFIPVQLLYFGQQFIGSDRAWNRQFAAVDSELLAGLRLHIHVGRRRRVVTNEHDRQAWMDPTPLQLLDLGGNFLFDVVSDL